MDYQDVFEFMVSKARCLPESAKQVASEWHGSRYISELRTVTIGSPRQTGNTEAVLKFASRHPGECLCVFRSKEVLRQQLTRYHQDFPDTALPRAFSIVDFIRNRAQVLDCLESPQDVRYVLVDNAYEILRMPRFHRTVFNQWVFDVFGPNIILILSA